MASFGEPAVSDPPADRVVVGRVVGVHGVKGWLKVLSFTEDEASLFDYQPWWVKMPDGWQRLEVDGHRAVARGFLAHVAGIDDRDQAALYRQRDISVPVAVLPATADGDYYWYQLEGLAVTSHWRGSETPLGVVTRLVETGANDVLVVKDDQGYERLLPYIDQVVTEVDLENGQMRVEWDPEF